MSRNTPTVNDGHVVVFREKYGNVYYSGAKGFGAIALAVFLRRDKEPDFYGYPTEQLVGPVEPPPIGGLMDAETLRFQHRRWTEYERLNDAWVLEQTLFLLAVRARTGDVEAAVEFIRCRKNHEYEGYSIETLVTP